MVITRTTFHIASVENGESAVSYEVALDTNSVTANGETGKFLTTNLGRFRFIKHIGGNSKEQNDVYDTFDYLMVFIGYDGKCLKYSDGGYYYSTNEGIDNIYSSMEVNDVAEEKVKLIKIFWYDGPVYADDNHNYIDRLCENLGVPAENIPLEILASNTFTVVRDGKKGDHGIGERGSSGPVWRQHVGFVSATADAPYQYYAGGNDERFLDVVLINKVWYRCLQSYKSTGTDDIRNTTTNVEFAKYWTSADMAGFTFIATQFLLADNAKINLFGSNEINLYDDNENGTLFASFRVPSGKYSDVDGDRGEYVLWIGAAAPLNAPYYVKKNGISKMNCCYFGKNSPIFDSAGPGIYYGEEYNNDASQKDDYHPYTRSVWFNDSGYTFGLSADNIIYETTGWGGFVKMWQMNAYDIINNDYSNKYPRLVEPAIEIRKSLSGLPTQVPAYDCIGIGLTTIANGKADSIGLDVSSFDGQNSIGLRISATGGTKTNHAIQITSGDIAGLRPYIRDISVSTTLDIYDHTIYCKNSSTITLTLPSYPIKGQEYLIIQGNARVNIKASHVIFGQGADGISKSWYSGTINQSSWLVFTGSVWVVQYINH